MFYFIFPNTLHQKWMDGVFILNKVLEPICNLILFNCLTFLAIVFSSGFHRECNQNRKHTELRSNCSLLNLSQLTPFRGTEKVNPVFPSFYLSHYSELRTAFSRQHIEAISFFSLLGGLNSCYYLDFYLICSQTYAFLPMCLKKIKGITFK